MKTRVHLIKDIDKRRISVKKIRYWIEVASIIKLVAMITSMVIMVTWFIKLGTAGSEYIPLTMWVLPIVLTPIILYLLNLPLAFLRELLQVTPNWVEYIDPGMIGDDAFLAED